MFAQWLRRYRVAMRSMGIKMARLRPAQSTYRVSTTSHNSIQHAATHREAASKVSTHPWDVIGVEGQGRTQFFVRKDGGAIYRIGARTAQMEMDLINASRRGK